MATSLSKSMPLSPLDDAAVRMQPQARRAGAASGLQAEPADPDMNGLLSPSDNRDLDTVSQRGSALRATEGGGSPAKEDAMLNQNMDELGGRKLKRDSNGNPKLQSKAEDANSSSETAAAESQQRFTEVTLDDKTSKRIKVVSYQEYRDRNNGIRPSKRLSLTASPKLPGNVWQQIFESCEPVSLARLSSVNKHFYAYLTASPKIELGIPSGRPDGLKNPEIVWAASRRLHFPDMPEPLKGWSEADMWRLIAAEQCQFCGRQGDPAAHVPAEHAGVQPLGEHGVGFIWAFGIRSCGACLLLNSEKEIDLLISSSIPSPLLPALSFIFLTPNLDLITSSALQIAPPAPTHTMAKYFFKSDLKSIRNRFEEVKSQGSAASENWLKSLPQAGSQQLARSGGWERWEYNGGLRKALHTLRFMRSAQQHNTADAQYNLHDFAQAQLRNEENGFGGIMMHTPQDSRHSSPTTSAQQSSMTRVERTVHEANELKAARKQDIERRCLELDPPIAPNLLQHMESYQNALQISTPLTDSAWAVLKPLLLAQREAAEKKENERLSQKHALQSKYEQRRLHDAQAKEEKEALDKEWEEAQAPIKKLLADYTAEILKEKWMDGKAINMDTSPKFAADVLIYVRQRFYARIAEENAAARAAGQEIKRDPENGPPTRRLILENMKWVFDHQIKPHTEHFRKELFLCHMCDNSKFYGFEGVVQHFAAKHTSTLSNGSVVVHWRAEWPEYPPFHPDPSAAKVSFYSIPPPGALPGQLHAAPGHPSYVHPRYPQSPGPLSQTGPPGPHGFPQYSPGPYAPPHYAQPYPGQHQHGPFAPPPPSYGAPGYANTHAPGFYREPNVEYPGYTGAPGGYPGPVSAPHPGGYHPQPGPTPHPYESPYPGPAYQPPVPDALPHGSPSYGPMPRTFNNQRAPGSAQGGPSRGQHHSVVPGPAPNKVGPVASMYQVQLDYMAGIAREIWFGTSGVKDLPGSVRIHVVIRQVDGRFKSRFSNDLTLSMFTDGLANHVAMKPIKNVNGLLCRACINSTHAPHPPHHSHASSYPPPDRKLYPISALLNHFQTIHIDRSRPSYSLANGASQPKLDWKMDMVELPERHVISNLMNALGMDDNKLRLIAGALPYAFPFPLPHIGCANNSGPVPVVRDSDPRSRNSGNEAWGPPSAVYPDQAAASRGDRSYAADVRAPVGSRRNSRSQYGSTTVGYPGRGGREVGGRDAWVRHVSPVRSPSPIRRPRSQTHYGNEKYLEGPEIGRTGIKRGPSPSYDPAYANDGRGRARRARTLNEAYDADGTRPWETHGIRPEDEAVPLAGRYSGHPQGEDGRYGRNTRAGSEFDNHEGYGFQRGHQGAGTSQEQPSAPARTPQLSDLRGGVSESKIVSGEGLEDGEVESGAVPDKTDARIATPTEELSAAERFLNAILPSEDVQNQGRSVTEPDQPADDQATARDVQGSNRSHKGESGNLPVELGLAATTSEISQSDAHPDPVLKTPRLNGDGTPLSKGRSELARVEQYAVSPVQVVEAFEPSSGVPRYASNTVMYHDERHTVDPARRPRSRYDRYDHVRRGNSRARSRSPTGHSRSAIENVPYRRTPPPAEPSYGRPYHRSRSPVAVYQSPYVAETGRRYSNGAHVARYRSYAEDSRAYAPYAVPMEYVPVRRLSARSPQPPGTYIVETPSQHGSYARYPAYEEEVHARPALDSRGPMYRVDSAPYTGEEHRRPPMSSRRY